MEQNEISEGKLIAFLEHEISEPTLKGTALTEPLVGLLVAFRKANPDRFDAIRGLLIDLGFRDNVFVNAIGAKAISKLHQALTTVVKTPTPQITDVIINMPGRLPTMDTLPVDFVLINNYDELRLAFVQYLDGVRKSHPMHSSESTVAYSLRLTAMHELHKWSNDEIDSLLTGLRRAARAVLQHVFTNLKSFEDSTGNLLPSRGYAELSEVYVMGAPLDALNWKFMKKKDDPRYENVHIDNWLMVAGLNFDAEDLPTVGFIKAYLEITREKKVKNPFATGMLNTVRQQLLSNMSSPVCIADAISTLRQHL